MPARFGLAAGIKPRGEERANILLGLHPPLFSSLAGVIYLDFL